MPNFIEKANLPSSNFVSALSRYASSTAIYYHIGNRKLLTFSTYIKRTSTVAKDSDFYMVVPTSMEYRPDKISYEIYGNSDFWWQIMEANNIKDLFELKAGTNLRIPSNIF